MLTGATRPLTDADYRSLAEFRHVLRRFLAFSEHAARDHGLTPAQHQLLLAIRGHAGPHPIRRSASSPKCCSSSFIRTGELADRAVENGLIERRADPADARRSLLSLTDEGRSPTRRALVAASPGTRTIPGRAARHPRGIGLHRRVTESDAEWVTRRATDIAPHGRGGADRLEGAPGDGDRRQQLHVGAARRQDVAGSSSPPTRSTRSSPAPTPRHITGPGRSTPDPANAARAAWLLSRTHAVLGLGELALHHADQCRADRDRRAASTISISGTATSAAPGRWPASVAPRRPLSNGTSPWRRRSPIRGPRDLRGRPGGRTVVRAPRFPLRLGRSSRPGSRATVRSRRPVAPTGASVRRLRRVARNDVAQYAADPAICAR